MCFIFCMLWIKSLCSSLIDNSLFSCGVRAVACFFHSSSSSIIWSWKLGSMLLRWVPPSFS